MLAEAIEIVLRTGDTDERRREEKGGGGSLPLLSRLENLNRARDHGLVAMAKVVPPNALKRLLRAAWVIGDEHAVDEARQKVREAFWERGKASCNQSGPPLPPPQEDRQQPHFVAQISDQEAATSLNTALAALTRDASEWHRRYGAASVIFNLAERTGALADLAPKLSTAQLAEVIEAIGGIQQEQLVAGGLAVLAPFLPAGLLERAFDILLRLPTAQYHWEALDAFLPRMAELGEPERAMAIVCGLNGTFADSYRSRIIAALAPHLPPRLLLKAMELSRMISRDDGRQIAIAAVDRRLPELPANELRELWASTVMVAASRGRAELLLDLVALPNTLRALRPQGFRAGLSQAIDDVARWWP